MHLANAYEKLEILAVLPILFNPFGQLDPQLRSGRIIVQAVTMVLLQIRPTAQDVTHCSALRWA